MQKNVKDFLKRISFCILYSAICIAPAHAFNSHAPFDISADMIDYVDADQSITADGHVVVLQGTSTLKADHMRYERQNQHLFARGHVFTSDNGAVMMGETLDYDLLKESGTVTSAMGYESPWIFTGAAWQKELDYFSGHDVSFTSCDLVDPHYHIRSSRVHLIPDSHFWAWNNVGYADTLPVFYSPFLYRNLGKRNVVIQFQPGHDDVNGNFVKTQTTIRFADKVYDKVLYDHYSVIGNGLGNEFDYDKPNVKGSLFGYYINPKANPELNGAPETEQYNVRVYHWQKIDPTLTLQSNVNYRKNISFNNQYFSEDINQSVNDINSSVALTKQTAHFNQRLVAEQLDGPDPGDTSIFAATHVQTASYPRYEATLYQMPLWTPGGTPKVSTASLQGGTTGAIHPIMAHGEKIGPLLLSANGSLANTYYRLDDQNHANGNGGFTLSQAIPLSRQFSLNPTVTPSLSWQDKFNPVAPPPVGSTTPVVNTGLFRGYQGRMATADTLRWRPASSFTIDQTYSLTARMAPNGTALDRPADGGIESHHVGWLAFWRPSRRILMRSFSGYDMRKIADELPDAYKQRKWDPWTSEFTLDTSRTSEFFGRYAVGFYPTRGELWEADYRHRGMYKTILETGLLYNQGTPGTLTWNNTLGLFISPGWRVDATVHALVNNTSAHAAVNDGSLIDESFIVTRDLHCWQAQFIYRNIPPFTREYSLLFNLKLGVKAEKDITNEDLESQYYPWRARTYAR